MGWGLVEEVWAILWGPRILPLERQNSEASTRGEESGSQNQGLNEKSTSEYYHLLESLIPKA